jgi:hypothetical protein
MKNRHSFDIEQIRQWIEVEGKPYFWIGKQIGYGSSSVARICNAAGIKTQEPGSKAKCWPIDKIRAWVEDEGKTHQWVAEQVGCSNQQISRLCKKNGIKTQRTGPRSGLGHTGWKRGRYLDKKGYYWIWSPDHPNKTKGGYVAEHRLVMESKLGRYLDRKEVVHHKDHTPGNNHPGNLMLFSSNGRHLHHELKGKCPQWTPEGKERLLEAARRKSNHAKSKPDVCRQAE